MTEKNIAGFDDAANGAVRRVENRPPCGYLVPPVDIREGEEALILRADLPGLSRESVEIHVENGVLTIQGRVADESKDGKLIAEFIPGPYYRRFRIPDTIDPQKAEAEFRDGVLTLTLPRAEKAKPRRIEVAAA